MDSVLGEFDMAPAAVIYLSLSMTGILPPELYTGGIREIFGISSGLAGTSIYPAIPQAASPDASDK